MSTGLDCRFYEKKPGEWYYDLERYERDRYDTYGKFPTFRAALRHLHDNHANPGGFSIDALPGCKHDLLAPEEEWNKGFRECERCGEHLDLRGDDEKARQMFAHALAHDAHHLVLAALADGLITPSMRGKIVTAGVAERDLDRALAAAVQFRDRLNAAMGWPRIREAVVADIRKAVPEAAVSDLENGRIRVVVQTSDFNAVNKLLAEVGRKHHVPADFSSSNSKESKWSVGPCR